MWNDNTLGELISAVYDIAHTESEDDEMADVLAVVSAYDLLLRSGNSHLALKLLNT